MLLPVLVFVVALALLVMAHVVASMGPVQTALDHALLTSVAMFLTLLVTQYVSPHAGMWEGLRTEPSFLGLLLGVSMFVGAAQGLVCLISWGTLALVSDPRMPRHRVHGSLLMTPVWAIAAVAAL